MHLMASFTKNPIMQYIPITLNFSVECLFKYSARHLIAVIKLLMLYKQLSFSSTESISCDKAEINSTSK